ncbi:unnamed protein product [Pleuronectes platessa]|uniref:Uncharacterized protein n=1 Tax=Pleuronectes platessa TaxID=8262 RepID=A0A9N7TR43_PLEPL|nr:unnamed protein product [Pleuronectes platessa]
MSFLDRGVCLKCPGEVLSDVHAKPRSVLQPSHLGSYRRCAASLPETAQTEAAVLSEESEPRTSEWHLIHSVKWKEVGPLGEGNHTEAWNILRSFSLQPPSSNSKDCPIEPV